MFLVIEDVLSLCIRNPRSFCLQLTPAMLSQFAATSSPRASTGLRLFVDSASLIPGALGYHRGPQRLGRRAIERKSIREHDAIELARGIT